MAAPIRGEMDALKSFALTQRKVTAAALAVHQSAPLHRTGEGIQTVSE